MVPALALIASLPPLCSTCLQELRQGKDFFVDNVQVKIWKGKVEGEPAPACCPCKCARRGVCVGGGGTDSAVPNCSC